jgi:N-acetylmuramoyl-L-alanine amidase
MKNLIQRSLATVGTAAFLALNALTPAHAGFVFEETEVNPDNVIAIAQPLRTQGYQGYKLLVLEQQSDARACWSEIGGGVGPVEVDPLLLDFDFTGICGRATDSNGYSARVNDTDLALTHNLSLQEVGGEVKLFAVSRGEKILIGSTKGLSDGFLKIDLKPGWRFTKRTYGDKVLGHFYLSNDNYIASDVTDEIETPDVEEENTDDVAVDIDVPEVEEEVAEEVEEEEVAEEVTEEVEEEEEVAEEVEEEEVAEEVEEEEDDDAIAQLPDEEKEEEEEDVVELNSNTWKQFLEMLRQSVK